MAHWHWAAWDIRPREKSRARQPVNSEGLYLLPQPLRISFLSFATPITESKDLGRHWRLHVKPMDCWSDVIGSHRSVSQWTAIFSGFALHSTSMSIYHLYHTSTMPVVARLRSAICLVVTLHVRRTSPESLLPHRDHARPNRKAHREDFRCWLEHCSTSAQPYYSSSLRVPLPVLFTVVSVCPKEMKYNLDLANVANVRERLSLCSS